MLLDFISALLLLTVMSIVAFFFVLMVGVIREGAENKDYVEMFTGVAFCIATLLLFMAGAATMVYVLR